MLNTPNCVPMVNSVLCVYSIVVVAFINVCLLSFFFVVLRSSLLSLNEILLVIFIGLSVNRGFGFVKTIKFKHAACLLS